MKYSNLEIFEHDGKSLTIRQWANIIGCSSMGIRYRLQRGMSFAEAISIPFKKTGLLQPIELNGITKTLQEWCKDLNICYSTASYRLRRGWPADKALNYGVRDDTPSCRRCKVYPRNATHEFCRNCWRILKPATDNCRRLVNDLRRRARDKGLEFNLTVDDIKIPAKCPLLGIPLYRGVGNSTGNSPSIDRIDSSRGYTSDNVWIISNRANTLKGNATLEELDMLVKGLKKKIRSMSK